MIKILSPLCLALLLRVVGHFPRENVCKISYELKETQFPSQTIDPQWTSIQELKSQKRGQYYTIWVLRVGQYFIISYAKTHMVGQIHVFEGENLTSPVVIHELCAFAFTFNLCNCCRKGGITPDFYPFLQDWSIIRSILGLMV